jgi:hypothetical protein
MARAKSVGMASKRSEGEGTITPDSKTAEHEDIQIRTIGIVERTIKRASNVVSASHITLLHAKEG